MTEPTDAEIADVARKAGLLPDNSHPAPETRATRRQADAVQAFARAVLTKWGTPAPVGVEPVARLEIGKTKGGVSITHIAEPAAFQLPEGMYALYTTPQPTQPQAGAVPLTDEQMDAIWEECKFDNGDEWSIDWTTAVRAAERLRGIKGGQHGAE